MKGGREGEMGRRVALSSSAWTREEEEEEKKGKQKQTHGANNRFVVVKGEAEKRRDGWGVWS